MGDKVSQRSGQAPEGKNPSSESVCKSSSALGYKAPPEPAAIATAIKERIRAFFTEVGKLTVNKRKDGMQSKIKEDKYKQVGKICRTEWEAGPLAQVYVLLCCGDAYKYTKIPNSNLISKHFRYSWSCLGAGGGLHDLLRPSQPLFSMILGGRNLHQLSWAGQNPKRQEFKSGKKKKIDLIHFSSSPSPGEGAESRACSQSLQFFLSRNYIQAPHFQLHQGKAATWGLALQEGSPPKIFIFPPIFICKEELDTWLQNCAYGCGLLWFGVWVVFLFFFFTKYTWKQNDVAKYQVPASSQEWSG